MVKHDEYPTIAQLYEKMTDLMLTLDPEFIRTCWKMSGLATLTHTHEESDNVAIAVANLDVRNDDEETCEPEPDTEDDIVEHVPCVVTIVQPTPGPTPIVYKKKQATITDFFRAKGK